MDAAEPQQSQHPRLSLVTLPFALQEYYADFCSSHVLALLYSFTTYVSTNNMVFFSLLLNVMLIEMYSVYSFMTFSLQHYIS